MKIIEMLDKMATGEISTKAKVKYGNARYKHKNWESLDYYIYQEFGKRCESEIKDFLNDEIEILDEEEFIDIEEITLNGEKLGYGVLSEWLGSKQTDNDIKLCSSIECLGITLNLLIKNQKKIIQKLNKDN